MQIYHGSENIIQRPVYGYGKRNNDYGLGFYCTQDYDLACEWAVDADRDGYANEYSLDVKGLKVLDLKGDNFNTLNWIAILLDNRDFYINSPIARESKRFLLNNYLPDYEKADIICGYRADDSYFAYARDFINNTISLQQLSEAMRYGKLGEQIVLKSESAFERIAYIRSDKVAWNVWYPKKESRDSIARGKYFDIDKNSFRRGETYMIKLLEEGI